MKILILVSVCTLIVGCQSYPSSPSKPHLFNKRIDVNITFPEELKGVEVEYVNIEEVKK